VTLQELNNKIHTIATPIELSLELPSIIQDIKTALTIQDSFSISYYTNHTGRELHRKLYNFGMIDQIQDELDSGFRPQTLTLVS